MKILIDMNLTPRWAVYLTAASIEAQHWSSIGKNDAPDREIADYARANQWIVLTNDLDFGVNLAANRHTGPSVVQVRADDVNPEAIGLQVLNAIRQMADDLAVGALLTIHPKRVRVSILPLSARR